MQEETAGPASPPASVAVEPLSLSSEPPTQLAKRKRTTKQPPQTDAEWMASLAASPAYAGIDVAREHAKAGVWHSERGRQLTRRSFINWLNRADKPLSTPTNGHSRRSFEQRNDYSQTGL